MPQVTAWHFDFEGESKVFLDKEEYVKELKDWAHNRFCERKAERIREQFDPILSEAAERIRTFAELDEFIKEHAELAYQYARWSTYNSPKHETTVLNAVGVSFYTFMQQGNGSVWPVYKTVIGIVGLAEYGSAIHPDTRCMSELFGFGMSAYYGATTTVWKHLNNKLISEHTRQREQFDIINKLNGAAVSEDFKFSEEEAEECLL